MKQCDCGVWIRFIKTTAGKSMPVECKETTVVTEKGEVIKGHKEHWSTCTSVSKYKARQLKLGGT